MFEEDEEVFVHPRDPYKRIDVLRTSRRVRVRVGDTVVADTTNARMLLESGLPVRWYLPPEDVRTDLLEPSYTTTRCTYKGLAHYWTLRAPEAHEKDLVWVYPAPFHDAEAVRGSALLPRRSGSLCRCPDERGLDCCGHGGPRFHHRAWMQRGQGRGRLSRQAHVLNPGRRHAARAVPPDQELP